MEKDKYGICLSFYAVVGFVLAFLGQILLSGLLLGFVIISTKNEWAIKQVMQAFFLALLSSCVSTFFGILSGFTGLPIVGVIIGGIFGFVSGIISLMILILVIIAIVKVNKGQDASVPIFSNMANKAYGYVSKKVYEAQ